MSTYLDSHLFVLCPKFLLFNSRLSVAGNELWLMFLSCSFLIRLTFGNPIPQLSGTQNTLLIQKIKQSLTFFPDVALSRHHLWLKLASGKLWILFCFWVTSLSSMPQSRIVSISQRKSRDIFSTGEILSCNNK